MKVIIYAYAHIIIDYYDLKMIFEIFELINSLKFKKIGRFLRKQGPFTYNFAKESTFFWFPKFLELFFTPKNTPLKVKNSKPDKSNILLGTPCR